MVTTTASAGASLPLEEKPVNGVGGLKHWRYDLVAGLVVSLVSLPLSLGIAVASGAPPVCGLISSIIAGLIFPFLGGAYVTISGPAAGLAPVVLASILTLGHGNTQTGYHLVLVAIFLAGCLQVFLSKIKAARLSAMFPASAIEGMLASIGLLIIAKQIPNLIGHPFKAHEFFPMLAEFPSAVLHLDSKVFAISAVCLLALFGLSSIKNPKLKLVPPQLLVVILGAALASIAGLEPKYLIKVPENILHGVVFPDFGAYMHDRSLWWPLVGCVLTLTFVDAFESLATIVAVDKLDPFHRKSDPDRTLFAMGTSNICSSLLGGLTIIPGGIKSTTCIVSGGRTLWANFYNAIFLLTFLVLGRHLINMIPLGVLAAILIHVGYKLCAPKKWMAINALGTEQMLLFSSTVFVTLATDLLIGLLFGTALKLVIAILVCSRTRAADGRVGCMIYAFTHLFSNPVTGHHKHGSIHRMKIDGPVVCFNAIHLSRELQKLEQHQGPVQIHFSRTVDLVDHTSMSNLLAFACDYERRGNGQVELIGIEEMSMRSKIESCMHVANYAQRAKSV